MTVASTTRLAKYTLNGVTTVFPVPFYFIENAHLTVWTLENDLPHPLVEGTDYTVTGAGDEDGGSLTTLTARDDGVLYIARVVPLTQLTDYPPNTPFPATSHERALDKLTMIVQQLQAAVSAALAPDPLDPDGPFDAHGKRIINLGDPIGETDAVNLRTLWTNIAGVVSNGLLVDPQIWKLTPDGTKKVFYLPGADITQTEFYDVLVDGTMIEPDDGYTVQIAPDPDNSTITFATAPGDGTEVWVVLRGYAKPASDYITTLVNDQSFINLLKSLITNTLYETTSVLNLGPTKFLIPLADVAGSATIDGSKESYLLRSTSGAPVTLTIRDNDGDVDLDWETNPLGAPYFSVMQLGDGPVTIAGTNLQVPAGFTAQTRGKNSIITCTLDYPAGGQWVLSGDLAPAAGATAVGAIPVKNLASAAGVVTLDFAQSSLFTLTLTENITGWTITNAPPAGNGATYRIQITQNASAANTVAWPASFKWPGGVKGSVSTGLSAVDLVEITTFDGGVSFIVTAFAKANA